MSMSKMMDATFSRRRAMQTLFCSSALLSMNLAPRVLKAAELAKTADDLHYLAIGDFGSGGSGQKLVADAMAAYVRRHSLKPTGLLLLGDNFYGKGLDGVDSPRWQSGFEQMYPSSIFDCPCPAVLGNHDYGDNVDGEKTQLAYAKSSGTRWIMPAKWYRMEFPKKDPLVTFLCIDSNLPRNDVDKKTGKVKPAMTPAETAEQFRWIETQLKSKRAPWTIVVGHHPVYSNGQHGDTSGLVDRLAPMLQKYSVPLYMCGHDHDMQHLELEGTKTSYVLSGGGGAKLRELKTPERKIGVFGKPVQGFTHLQINPNRLLIRHLDPEGQQIHAFEKNREGQVRLQTA